MARTEESCRCPSATAGTVGCLRCSIPQLRPRLGQTVEHDGAFGHGGTPGVAMVALQRQDAERIDAVSRIRGFREGAQLLRTISRQSVAQVSPILMAI